jgi:hypothetical protein
MPKELTIDEMVQIAKDIHDDEELNNEIYEISRTIMKGSNKIDLNVMFSDDGKTVGGGVYKHKCVTDSYDIRKKYF